ncbi:hypothetical protein VRRI112168_19250 [Vreelandella rituensis]|uniref:Uncharacterized protein n=1 Tax=Vreelandella rituensis TaxID=2282306 RepID=A0A368U6I6_9GAMM|nr:hypothetical protein [Halomonas rituensis]RCV92564.1 hypothetical protein DU506_06765 [Halomonas rituensis]
MNIRFTIFTILLLSTAVPALAAWQTQQSDGVAQASYTGEVYLLTISCTRSSQLKLTLEDMSSSGDQLDGIHNLMMWITVPDGRTDRWPVRVTRNGLSLIGTLHVSDFNLGFFQNAQRFQLDAPSAGVDFLEGDMIGTGAARLAFKEQCGI